MTPARRIRASLPAALACLAGMAILRGVGLLAAAQTLAAASSESAAPDAAVSTVRTGRVTQTTVTLPGRLIGCALPWHRAGAGAGGTRREILLLVSQPEVMEDADGGEPGPGEPPCSAEAPSARRPQKPRMLLRLDVEGEGSIRTLSADLPGEIEGIESADLDGDGRQEIVLVRRGRIDVVRDAKQGPGAGSLELLVADAALAAGGRGPLAPRGVRAGVGEPAAFLDIAVLGEVRFYGPSKEGGAWGPRCSAELPLRASRDDSGLRLASPKVREVGVNSAGAWLFASGPEPLGRERLRTILMDPAAGPVACRTEVWSQLPGPERLVESAYLMIDGRPALVAITRPAEKLSLLGEKLLRLFFLDEPDRSRAGSEAVLAVESGMNLWQLATLSAVDVNRDGRRDLVIGYWKGLKDTQVVLDVHVRQADGAFSRSATTTTFEVERGDRSFVGFGDDLDADGLPDLMLLAAGGLSIHLGSPASKEGKGLVGNTPAWTIPLPHHDNGRDDDEGWEAAFGASPDGSLSASRQEAADVPRAVDLDGDGRPEILFAAEAAEGRSEFHVIRIAPR